MSPDDLPEEVPPVPVGVWQTDIGLMEGGPLNDRIFTLTPVPNVGPPIHMIFSVDGRRVTYKRIMFGRYPSRNDRGQLRYAYQDPEA